MNEELEMVKLAGVCFLKTPKVLIAINKISSVFEQDGYLRLYIKESEPYILKNQSIKSFIRLFNNYEFYT